MCTILTFLFLDPQSLPVAQVENRRGAPLCIVPSVPVKLGTVSPHRSTDVFVLDVDKFLVQACSPIQYTLDRIRSHSGALHTGGGVFQGA